MVIIEGVVGEEELVQRTNELLGQRKKRGLRKPKKALTAELEKGTIVGETVGVACQKKIAAKCTGASGSQRAGGKTKE